MTPPEYILHFLFPFICGFAQKGIDFHQLF